MEHDGPRGDRSVSGIHLVRSGPSEQSFLRWCPPPNSRAEVVGGERAWPSRRWRSWVCYFPRQRWWQRVDDRRDRQPLSNVEVDGDPRGPVVRDGAKCDLGLRGQLTRSSIRPPAPPARGTSGAQGSSSGSSSATFTSLPAVGQIIGQGQALYDINGAPVVLLYGSTPAFRTLSDGVTGSDVSALNADLVALGYATGTELPAGSDEFGYWTEVGVERIQAASGIAQTGVLDLGQVVFLPTAVRVTSLTATLGGPAQTGTPVLDATSTTREVSIDLDTAQQSEVSVGDKVTITLPNNQTTPGVITSVGTVASTASSSSDSSSSSTSSDSDSSGSTTPTITVLVTPTDPSATGDWDQAPVNVNITAAAVKKSMVVPIDALLALTGGGYAVEVVSTSGVHTLVAVSLGLFDDAAGLVQVTNSTLQVGDKIVVPAA